LLIIPPDGAHLVTGPLYHNGPFVTSLLALRRFDEALPDCERVLSIDPDFKYARGNLLYAKLSCCDWLGLAEETAA